MTTKISAANLGASITTLIGSGGGPKVTAITYPGNDLAADTAGGQTITLTGTGFAAGCSVFIGATQVSVVTVVSATSVTFTSLALAAATYTLYLVNTDGGTATIVPGISYSGTPTWSTAAGTLGSVYEYSPISNATTATGDGSISYSVFSGTLPTGSSLNTSTGVITGTSPASAGATTYTFVIRATDAQLQDTDRSFSITINTDTVTWTTPAANSTVTLAQNAASTTALVASSAAGKAITYTSTTLPTGLSISGATVTGTPTVVGNTTSTFTATAATTNRTATAVINWTVSLSIVIDFPYTTLLLSGAAATKTFIADASTNNFAVTIAGDTKPNNFNPYTPGYYSNYFDGTGDYLSTTVNLAIATGPFTMEAWVYLSALGTERTIFNNLYWQNGNNGGWQLVVTTTNNLSLKGSTNTFNSRPTVIQSSSTLAANTWTHVAVVRDSNNLINIYFNGVSAATAVTYAASLNQGTGQLFRIGAWTPDGGSQDFWLGYISNARVVVGTAVYTGTFTPSTTPLTAIANTSLLTCRSNRFVDNSTNAYAITRVGDTTVSPTTPFVPNTTYATYGSTYFDGTGDYLTTPSSSLFNLNGINWTVEGWFNLVSATSDDRLFVFAGASVSWGFYRRAATGNIYFGQFGTDEALLGNMLLNEWTHLALVRTSGPTISLYKNGVFSASTAAYSMPNENCTFLIAGNPAPYANTVTKGYVSDVRVVKGTALYTTTFTPPIAPLTAITNTSLLTLQTNQPVNNSVFLDNSTNAFAVTQVGNTTQGTFSPYGANWSNYFDGSGDKLTLPSSSAFDLSNSTWTIEFWMYSLATPTAGNGCRLLIAGDNGGAASWDIQYNNDGSIGFFRPYAGSPTAIYSSAGTIALNTWYHIAVVCNAGSARLYINGVLVAGPVTISLPTSAAQGLRIGYDDIDTVNFQYNGYLSNVRIVKGVAVYTSAFTPSTTPLTATQSSGTNISAITGTATSLLTCQSNRFVDNSTNAFAVTITGNVAVQRFSPFSPTAAYSTSTIGGSAYCDGTSDFLQVSANSALNQSGDLTIEMWVYLNATPSVILTLYGFEITNYMKIGINTTRNLVVDQANVGPKVTSTNTIPLNAWAHIAFVRSGSSTNNCKIYINGTSQGQFTDTSNVTVTGTGIILAKVDSTTYSLNGYATDVRYSNAAIYTSAFTPPTAPLSAITSTKLLCNFTNGAIFDNAMMNDLETVGNAQISTSVKKYGTGSMYFDGTGDGLYRPSSDLYNFGVNNFTIEFWIYFNSKTGYQTIISSGYTPNTANGWIVQTGNGDGKIIFYKTTGGTTVVIATDTGSTVNTGQWYHIAIVRSASTTTIYRDGTSVGSGGDTNTYSASASLYIGGGSSVGFDNYFLNGYIDDLRITKGYARYTANFTPPTAALPTQ